MLCNVCGKNPATVHLTEIIDEQMNELHLCEECARQKSTQMESQFGLSDLLAGLADFSKPDKEEGAVLLKCPNCGLTYADFKKIGRLGCSECYGAFRDYLVPLLKRIHGSTQHIGKVPIVVKAGAAKPSAGKKKVPALDELRQSLQKAVQNEAFEEAARLRDEIKKLEKKQNAG
jgi:protein arginine kinase activator